MRTVLGLALAAMTLLPVDALAQRNSNTTRSSPLVLTGAIPLESVHGRIDHFGFDPNNRLFVSALGNNTEEVIDLSAQRVVRTITGVPAPQGVVFSPETNKLFVASTKGKLYIYDGTSFDLLTTIDFHGDADNLRYDAAEKRCTSGTGRMKLRQSEWWTRPRTSVWTKSSRREHTQSRSNSKRQGRTFM